MKNVSLFLSMIAFVSFVAISPASAQTAPKKVTTAQPVVKKACCSDPTAATCTKKDSKTCTGMKAKKTAAVTTAK